MAMIIRTALFVGVIAASAVTGEARDRYDPDRAYGAIQAERERQRSIVEQGRSDGSLTFMEKYSIGREQARINALERERII